MAWARALVFLDVSRYLKNNFLHNLGVPIFPEPSQMDLPKNHFLKVKFNNIDLSQLGSCAVLA